MMDDDFYEGSGYEAVYRDCQESGALAEAREDILGQLAKLGVRETGYGPGGYELRCQFSADDVLRMTRLYRTKSDCEEKNALQLMAYDDDDGFYAIGIEEPYYGWSGFDDGLMKEALRNFADRLIGRITMTKDLPGQGRFEFDDDYLDNPDNARREK